jgi:hypothetical protein
MLNAKSHGIYSNALIKTHVQKYELKNV